jgi:hypothetical protein
MTTTSTYEFVVGADAFKYQANTSGAHQLQPLLLRTPFSVLGKLERPIHAGRLGKAVVHHIIYMTYNGLQYAIDLYNACVND